MKKFMDEDFLLQNDLAKKLFSGVKDLPIVDYHCHLNPKEIAENKRFKNITEIWLGGDHYKWRLMRANGVDERYITGDADDYDKFEKWAETIEDCIGSPIYHWTHLELKRYFGYDGLLGKNTAKEVWEQCNKVISSPDFDVWTIFEKFHVESLCTTDDPADSLEYHQKIKESGIKTKVLPTLRPGKAYNIENAGYAEYVAKLAEVADVRINNYGDLIEALYKRVDFFDSLGCRLSDNALDPPVYEECSSFELDVIVKKALDNKTLDDDEINKYKTALMIDLAKKYSELGWTMQIHMNALRNNNSRMFEVLGADTGYDSIDDAPCARSLSKLLDAMDGNDQLPRTILYSLNPSADDIITTMIGNFQGGGIKGKLQHGSGWWFNDTKTGMQKQMTSLANNGLLARFVGMLTDSRSFLSYTRHEYFRRVLINLIVGWVEDGEFPDDYEKLVEITKNISYYNAKEYFKF